MEPFFLSVVFVGFVGYTTIFSFIPTALQLSFTIRGICSNGTIMAIEITLFSKRIIY
jgi:hypothetical protein